MQEVLFYLNQGSLDSWSPIHLVTLHPCGVGLFQDHPLRYFLSNPNPGGRTSDLTRTACTAYTAMGTIENRSSGTASAAWGPRAGGISNGVYSTAVEPSRSRSPLPGCCGLGAGRQEQGGDILAMGRGEASRNMAASRTTASSTVQGS
jgi:hypothetical protein